MTAIPTYLIKENEREITDIAFLKERKKEGREGKERKKRKENFKHSHIQEITTLHEL